MTSPVSGKVDRNEKMRTAALLRECVMRTLSQRYLNVFMRYTGIGIIGTVMHFLLLYLLIGPMGAVAASTMGAIAGCVVNFLLARTYVFSERQAQIFAFPKFATVAIGGIALNASMMSSLTLISPVFISQMVSTGTVFLFGFLLNNFWSFYERRS